MHDSCSWWNYFEFVKCALSPTEEAITLLVALIFNISVLLKGGIRAEEICDN